MEGQKEKIIYLELFGIFGSLAYPPSIYGNYINAERNFVQACSF
jgi:hypothetical protein